MLCTRDPGFGKVAWSWTKDPFRNKGAILAADASRRASLLVGLDAHRYARLSRLAGRAPRRPIIGTFIPETRILMFALRRLVGIGVQCGTSRALMCAAC